MTHTSLKVLLADSLTPVDVGNGTSIVGVAARLDCRDYQYTLHPVGSVAAGGASATGAHAAAGSGGSASRSAAAAAAGGGGDEEARVGLALLLPSDNSAIGSIVDADPAAAATSPASELRLTTDSRPPPSAACAPSKCKRWEGG